MIESIKVDTSEEEAEGMDEEIGVIAAEGREIDRSTNTRRDLPSVNQLSSLSYHRHHRWLQKSRKRSRLNILRLTEP